MGFKLKPKVQRAKERVVTSAAVVRKEGSESESSQVEENLDASAVKKDGT